MSGELARVERTAMAGVDDALQPDVIVRQVNLIQQVMKAVMKKDEHYGIIPGTDKPTLLKPGAEKLNMTFRFAPSFTVEVVELPSPPGAHEGHREYRVRCVLTHIPSGAVMGEGVGSASTLETKWRYRSGPGELTDKPVPQEYWNIRKTDPAKAQELLGGKGFITKKNDAGVWVIAIRGERVEFDNPADNYNTCLKMGKKRALVDATLTATAASDIFTQDLEEIVENEKAKTGEEAKHEEGKPAPAEVQQGADEKPYGEEDMRDELYVIAKAIADIEGIEVSAVINSLTATAKFKGYVKTADIPSSATYQGKTWNPLEKTLEKARKKLKEMKEPGDAT
jgi:hypothetical protein